MERKIAYVLFFLGLFSCSSSFDDSIVKDFNATANQNEAEKEISSHSEGIAIDWRTKLLNLPEYVLINPDSSYAIELTILEGTVEGFKIIGQDSVISRAVYLPNDILGGIDYSKEIWENDTLLLLPNVGATANGYYQMRITHLGDYSFTLKAID